MIRVALVVLTLMAPAAAYAEMRLPAGFTAEVYVTGRGEAPDGRAAIGIPSTTSLAFDAAGALYATRTGRRYRGGEIEDLWPVLRFPPGGARVGGDVSRYFYGPPLLNAQLGAARGQELLLTTFDRDRGLGVLYRVLDGRAELLAGGTPPPGEPPLFKQPEGVAIDGAGNVYVADRHNTRILALAADGGTIEVATFTDGDAPRTLAWAPTTDATRRAGIAGDLFVVVTRRGTWSLNEIVRISGPFDELMRTGSPAR